MILVPKTKLSYALKLPLVTFNIMDLLRQWELREREKETRDLMRWIKTCNTKQLVVWIHMKVMEWKEGDANIMMKLACSASKFSRFQSTLHVTKRILELTIYTRKYIRSVHLKTKLSKWLLFSSVYALYHTKRKKFQYPAKNWHSNSKKNWLVVKEIFKIPVVF